MADENTGGENGEQARKDWMNDAQDALQRAGDAIRAAWDASKPARASALDAARQAARELDDALERGMAAARQRWDKSQSPGTPVGEEPAPETPAAETSDDSGPSEEE